MKMNFELIAILLVCIPFAGILLYAAVYRPFKAAFREYKETGKLGQQFWVAVFFLAVVTIGPLLMYWIDSLD